MNSMISMMARVGLISCATLVLATVAHAQDLPYESGSTGADQALTFREIPVGGRSWLSGVYDPIRGRFVIFGGWVNSTPDSQTWSWDGSNWSRLSTATTPPERTAHRMVWDPEQGHILMFGGDRRGTALNDTWAFDGTDWRELKPGTVPPGRHSHVLVYDADRRRTVLFGGTGGNTDTWLWNGTDWSITSPATKPPLYGTEAAAYHPPTQRVVLFNPAGETWLWDGQVWTKAAPVTLPTARSHARMVFDPERSEVVMFGGDSRNDLWTWNGVNWNLKSPAFAMEARANYAMDYHAGLKKVVLFGGYTGTDQWSADTFLWDGTNWELSSGKRQQFDMSGRANGLWHFTSIDVPPGVTVGFKKNAANTPVRWLASGPVTIRGVLDLNGQDGVNTLPLNVVAEGGPGGFSGGRGAVRRDQSGSSVGSPGQGPGGGLPGTQLVNDPTISYGKAGEYSGAYGNVFIQPLVGGSGGGGGASSDTANGGNGGGAGGAILIASSRDIEVTGAIRANGGVPGFIATSGGYGSGGSILLRADRISGTGVLEANGSPSVPGSSGRIRLEAFFRSLAGQTTPVSVNSAPSANRDFNTIGTLVVSRIAGGNVRQPPSGNSLTPDVVFTAAGPVTIEVTSSGIPDGTPVRLRIASSSQVITPRSVNLAGNRATFQDIVVPAGVGTVQAFAEFTVSNTP